MTILYLACLNNDPVIYSLLGPKCNPAGGEPLRAYFQLGLMFIWLIHRHLIFLEDISLQFFTKLENKSVLFSNDPITEFQVVLSPWDYYKQTNTNWNVPAK